MPGTNSLDAHAVRQLLLSTAERIIAAEAELTEADRRLGDGDHGLGMERGFQAVKAKLDQEKVDNIGKTFATAGLTMLGTMGGASGALFGTLFRAGGKAIEKYE